jgi:hypothetical protein
MIPSVRRACVECSLALVSSLAAAACASSRVPDPQDAVSAFASAISRGDTDAVYELMSTSAHKSRSREDMKRVLLAERDELVERTRALTAHDAHVESFARLRFADGEETTLELRAGRFLVTTAGALPGGARSPVEALDQLRRVLARRSYAGLMRVLSPATRASIEQDLRTLVTGLERPDALQVQLSGDAASIVVPGGHHVRLRREDGIWRVEDFD